MNNVHYPITIGKLKKENNDLKNKLSLLENKYKELEEIAHEASGYLVEENSIHADIIGDKLEQLGCLWDSQRW